MFINEYRQLLAERLLQNTDYNTTGEVVYMILCVLCMCCVYVYCMCVLRMYVVCVHVLCVYASILVYKRSTFE